MNSVIVLLAVIGMAVAAPQDIFANRLAGPMLPYHMAGLSPMIRSRALIEPTQTFHNTPLALPHAIPAPIPTIRNIGHGPVLHQAPHVPLAISHRAPHVTGPAQQHHSQDEIGQFRYGYTNPDSYKEEVGAADGTVSGQYGWISPEGDRIHISYTAGHHGFHPTGSHIPQ